MATGHWLLSTAGRGVESINEHSESPGRRWPEPPERSGLSVGAKIGIGCGILLVLFLVAAGVLVYYVQRSFQELSGGREAHIEAAETFARLAEQYPFAPPADSVVQAEQASRFIAVSDEVWREAQPWADELNHALGELSQEEGRGGIKALSAAFRGLSRLMRVRLLLAAALERQGMSAAEYAWVGAALVSAYRALDEPADEAVPAANLELARSYRSELAGFAEDESPISKQWMLMMAENTEMGPGLWKALEPEPVGGR